jgi:hypothetical protein
MGYFWGIAGSSEKELADKHGINSMSEMSSIVLRRTVAHTMNIFVIACSMKRMSNP